MDCFLKVNNIILGRPVCHKSRPALCLQLTDPVNAMHDVKAGAVAPAHKDGAGHRPSNAYRSRCGPHHSAGERSCGPAGHPVGIDEARRTLPPYGRIAKRNGAVEAGAKW